MIVQKLIFIRTGNYQPQASRPYWAHSTPQLTSQLIEQTHGGQKIEVANLAGIAGQVMRPMSEAQGIIGIVNGWDITRLRFFMEVHFNSMEGIPSVQYLTGYTDFDGLSNTGDHIAADMRMYINNSITTRRQTFNTAYGTNSTLLLKNASQILVGEPMNDYRGLPTAMHTARPEDVFGAIGALRDDYDDRKMPSHMHMHAQETKEPIYDMRSPFVNGPMKKSNRINGSSPHYLSRLLKTYRSAMLSADPLHDFSALANSMCGMVREETIGTDQFMSGMINNGSSLAEGTSFTYGELTRFAQAVNQNTTVIHPSKPSERARDYRMGTSEWTATTNETIVATVLMHSMPSILVDFMITDIGFHLHNRTIGGQPYMAFSHILSFVDGMDMRHYAEPLQQRIFAEVFRDITRNGDLDMEIMGRINMLGDSVFTISMMGGPAVEFAAPQFCDALLAPVVANNIDSIHAIARDVDVIADAIGRVDLAPNQSNQPYGALAI